MIAATLMVKIAADSSAFTSALQKAQQSVRGSAQQMEQASTAVTALQSRMKNLNDAYRLGAISEAALAREMRTVIADARQLAATSDLTARSQQRLSQLIGTSERQLRAMGTQARRSVDGLEAVAVAANGMALAATQGAQGVAMATSSLQQLAISMKAVQAVGIIGAIGAIATVVMTLVRAFKESSKAADEASEAFQRMSTGRLQGLIATNVLNQQLLRGGTLPAAERNRLAGSVGIPFQQRALMTPTALSELTAARLGVEESALRAALRIAQERLHVERAITSTVLERSGLSIGPGRKAMSGMIPGADAAAFYAAQKNAAQLGATVGTAALNAIPIGGPQGGPEGIAGLGKMQQFAKGVVSITSSVQDAVTNMAAAIGAGLASGANLFKTFAQSAVASIGAIIVAIGRMLIAKGIGDIIRALPFAGPAAIAVGAGLVIAGTAMGASRSGAGGGGGGGSSFASVPTGSVGGESRAPTHVNEIVFVTSDGREISRQVVETDARQQRLGRTTTVVPLTALVLAGPLTRAG